MKSRPKLFRAEWVLPVAVPPIHRGEVLVDATGSIAAVAPSGVIDLPADLEVHELGAAILLPGLVNVHAHPELTMFRGLLEDLPFRDWIMRLVGYKRNHLLPEDSVAAAVWHTAEAMAAGITTVGATEASGAAVQALTTAGLRGVVYQEVFGPDPIQAPSAIQELTSALDRLGAAAGDRVRLGVSPHAPYTVSDELYRLVAEFAAERGMPVAVHIAESRTERDLVSGVGGDFAPGLNARGIRTPRRGRTPIDLLARVGVLAQRPLLIHCVDLDEADIAAIAAARCPVAHCPIANAKLGHGIAPVVRLLDAGVTVGVGTDSVGSNNRIDILEEARFAGLLQRGATASYSALGAEQLLRLCTIDGARALGLDGRTGTLEPGKSGDLCAVRVGGISTTPNFDPTSTLFYSARGSDVVLTVVEGEILYQDGRFRTIDMLSAKAGIEAAAQRLAEARRI